MNTFSLTRYARCLGISACLVGSIALLPQAAAADSDAKRSLSAQDQAFVKEAAMGGLYEVQAGQLAAQKASSAEVKQMGQHIADDHTKAGQKLEGIAQMKGVRDLPTQLDAKHQRKIDSLNKLSGPDFDRQYSKMMVADHKEDIKKFQKEAESGSDPDLKQFAADTLPKLKQHLAMSESGTHAAATDKGTTSQSSASEQKKSSTQQ
jgi:putative membrane protein